MLWLDDLDARVRFLEIKYNFLYRYVLLVRSVVSIFLEANRLAIFSFQAFFGVVAVVNVVQVVFAFWLYNSANDAFVAPDSQCEPIVVSLFYASIL